MAEPFMGEIRIYSFNFAPKGWAFCNGQLMPINQNQALFSLMGTRYGGDGRVTFGLPDLRGRAAIHQGGGFTLGQAGGETNHTLTLNEMPAHNHFVQVVNAPGTAPVAINNFFAQSPNQLYHSPDANLTPLNPASISNVGGSQPHSNMQPFLGLNICVALMGIFPSRN